MSTTFTIHVDGAAIPARPGQTIMEACDAAGLYIPRLCDVEGLAPQGSCRVCTVRDNGRCVSACTQPAMPEAVIECDTESMNRYRRDLVTMLLHEGNHLCPGCEASGRCELQAMAYRLGITDSNRLPYLQPVRPLDASHPLWVLDTNRCIFCSRCIRASREQDGKNVFEYVGRGIHKRLAVNGNHLADTSAQEGDHAMSDGICPVGCIIRKGEGFSTPIGQRRFDKHLIGEEIENKSGRSDLSTEEAQ